MNVIISEKNGIRKFERVSRWNVLTDTIISRSNKLAKYADNAGNKQDDKLWITCFKISAKVYPLQRYAKISPTIILEDHSTISRQDTEDSNYYLEVNKEKGKVRLYREVV